MQQSLRPLGQGAAVDDCSALFVSVTPPWGLGTAMGSATFDINCDMGEGFGNWRMGDDAAVMPLISTANLACGFHAGDPLIMQRTVAMAKAAGVAVGAHPGLPDMMGFGRRTMALSPDDVHAYFVYQVGALAGFLQAAGMSLNHVKPHGAMFHVLREPALADAAIDAITATAPGAAIYWMGPAWREPLSERAAARGLRVVLEAYPDLDYTDDGSLIVERVKRPVEPETIHARMVEIIREKTLTTRSGVVLPMDVESVCIHSDGPNALAVIEAARRAVADCGREVGCATRDEPSPPMRPPSDPVGGGRLITVQSPPSLKVEDPR